MLHKPIHAHGTHGTKADVMGQATSTTLNTSLKTRHGIAYRATFKRQQYVWAILQKIGTAQKVGWTCLQNKIGWTCLQTKESC
mmetsp:Transcript_3964/g.9321  ORF Transcript_3964/g.9321 Transcript_3964/m.9321 type:complete len:83 (+) Transcript_3964:1196-1444(+)